MTNVNGAVTTGEFMKFLAGRTSACSCFIVVPPAGISMTAAIDWRVVVPGPAVAPELAAALWDGYEAFILPLPAKDAHTTAGIIVQIRNSLSAFDQFLIGKDITDKEALAHRLKESTRILCTRTNLLDHAREIEETQQSDYWVEITGK